MVSLLKCYHPPLSLADGMADESDYDGQYQLSSVPMKYNVIAANGVPIARYETESEFRTFLKASYPHIDPASIAMDRVGSVDIKDDKNEKTLATITVTE